MRPILCVIDLTDSSVKVLEVAARMAYANKAPLTILYPYRLINHGYLTDLAKLKTKLEQEAKEKFALLQKQAGGFNHITHDFQPEIGFPADRISAYVKRNKLDLIIISQAQANTINELNGMGLQNLITNSKLPFMIVPEEMDVAVFSV